MTNFLSHFIASEDGAVTIDWVVLTAALLTLGIVVGYTVSDGAKEMAAGTGAELGAATVPEVRFP